jgi:hypothetical protein
LKHWRVFDSTPVTFGKPKELDSFLFNRTGPHTGSEGLLGCATDGATPFVRQVFKKSAFGNLSLFISLVRIVKTTAIDCLALIHFFWFYHVSLPLWYKC